MKTTSADYKQSNYTVPVDLKTMRPHRHFHIEIPSLNIIRILTRPGHRFRWVAASMLIQSIFITAIISIIILSTGNWLPFWFAATASMHATFIPSLSGQELKWIEAVFFINCLVSMLTILAAFIHFLIDLTVVYVPEQKRSWYAVGIQA